MLVETLRADWAARATAARVSALPEFANGALTLGAGTKLAEARANRRDEAAEGERSVALVSVALGRPLDASAATHVRRALAMAREGDAPLALTHLALAGAGRLTEPHEDAQRLFIADGLMKAGVAPSTILTALGAPSTQTDLDRAYDPDQPRVPAGNGRPSGRWTSGDWGDEANSDANRSKAPSPQQTSSVADTSENWAPYLTPAPNSSAARAGAHEGVPVLLPNGQLVPTNGDTPYLVSPTADLAPVATAGRQVGDTYREILADPDAAGNAILYLYSSLAIYVGQGGTFDYQRAGNWFTGFAQLSQFRNVSNFNVGLFCQQAGMTLDETLELAGLYARLFSSNAKPLSSFGLDEKTRAYIVLGYETGASGVYDPPNAQ